MKKTVQFLTPEYLEECQKMTIEQRIEFFENFKELCAEVEGSERSKSKLISMKVPENLLNTFRILAEANRIPYQTQIKKLMIEWVKSQS